MKKVSLYFPLLVLPIVFFTIEYFKFPLLPHYYSTNPDPTYIYLMNGLNIANGNWELGHYDNPGTPLHMLTGCILFFTHLFSSNKDIVIDVLQRPEYYISICAWVLISIKTLSVIILGIKVFKASASLLWALTFQLIPFFVLYRLACPALIHPDILLDTGLILFLAFAFPIIKATPPATQTLKDNFRQYWVIAMIIGGMVATKFSVIGIVFFALFLIPGLKNKMFFLMQCILFFYLFTLPVFSQLDEFWSFISGILTHKGQYGSGEQGFIEPASFWSNVREIYKTELTLITTSFILLFILLHSGTKKNKSHFFFVALGALLMFVFQTITIGKHYSYHYTLPMHYLFIPSLFLFSTYSVQHISLIKKNISPAFVFLGFITALSIAGIRFLNSNVFTAYYSSLMVQTDAAIEKKESYPSIYFSGKGNSFLTSSSVKPALWFGKIYSGYHTRWKRAETLENIYPASFFYNEYFNSFENWNEAVPVWKIFRENPVVYVYEREKGLYPAKELIKNKLQELQIDSAVTMHITFENSYSKEIIYELKIDTAFIKKKWRRSEVLHFNFDSIASNSFFSSEGKVTATGTQYFKHGIGIRNSNCIAIKDKNPVHLTTLKVQQGDYLSVSIWRKSIKSNNYLELRSGNGFYHHTSYVTARSEGWEKVTINYEIPQNFSDSISITLRNAGKSEILYDDLTIETWNTERKKALVFQQP